VADVDRIETDLEPLRASILVTRSPADAFAIFTERIASWWPLDEGHSVYAAECASCGIEPRVGGEVFELAKDGRRAVWGTVIAWEPPRRFAMTWHPGRTPDTAQEVELRFVPVTAGTRVELEHRGWSKLGVDAPKARKAYENGWAVVFGRCYKEACES
jgi:hypothetical protein